jgi:ABC-type multidrug transport system ATPase subunit
VSFEVLNYIQFSYLNRKKLLGSILQLPDDNQVISQCSGGQQKRVSLALAFLNTPQLVILDEPTVGTDPILGKSIWNYLHSCCADGVSVVIVTHYIEEASLAHMVGIMRNGKLMEEGVPNQLLIKYGETTLENVFLKLCRNEPSVVVQDSNNNILIQINGSKNKESNNNQKIVNNKNINEDRNTSWFLNLWILMILVRKNFSKFLQFNLTFLVFLIPAFQALILCVLYDRSSIPVSYEDFDFDFNRIAIKNRVKSY